MQNTISSSELIPISSISFYPAWDRMYPIEEDCTEGVNAVCINVTQRSYSYKFQKDIAEIYSHLTPNFKSLITDMRMYEYRDLLFICLVDKLDTKLYPLYFGDTMFDFFPKISGNVIITGKDFTDLPADIARSILYNTKVSVNAFGVTCVNVNIKYAIEHKDEMIQ